MIARPRRVAQARPRRVAQARRAGSRKLVAPERDDNPARVW